MKLGNLLSKIRHDNMSEEPVGSHAKTKDWNIREFEL